MLMITKVLKSFRLKNLCYITKGTMEDFCINRQISSGSSFKVLGLQQIAIGGLDKQALASFWIEKLGIEKIGSYKAESENVDEDILKLGKGLHSIELDIMTPINPEKSPKVHQPALNHIGLWVDNIENAVTELSSKGVIFTPGGIRKGASGHNVTFIHPKSAVGVLVELVQAPSEIIDSFRQ